MFIIFFTSKRFISFLFFINVFLFLCYADIRNDSDQHGVENARISRMIDKALQFQQEQNHDSALFYFIQAARSWKRSGNIEEFININIEIANIFSKLFLFDSAEYYYEVAENQCKRKLAKPNLLAEIYYLRGTNFVRQNNPVKSIPFFDNCIALASNFPEIDSVTILKAFNNLGVAYYYLGEFDKAILNYEKSLEINKKIAYGDLISGMHNIGQIYFKYGDHRKALMYFKEALELNRSMEEEKQNFQIYLNIGAVLNEQRQYDQAIDYYNQALGFFRKMGNDHFVASTLNEIGRLYLNLNIFDKAESHFLQALTLIESLNYQRGIAKTLNNLGSLKILQKEYDQALEFFYASMNIREKGDFGDLAAIYNNIAQINTKKVCKQEAILYFKKAIRLSLVSKEFIMAASYYRNLGDCFYDFKDYDSAFHYYFVSQKLLTPESALSDSFVTVEINYSISDIQLLRTLKRKAALLYVLSVERDSQRVFYLENALNTYSVIIDLIDKIRTGYYTFDSKLFIAKNEKKTFFSAAEICDQLYRITGLESFREKLFWIAEKGKAAILYELIRENEVRQYIRIKDTFLEKEHDLKQKLAFYKNAVYEENTHIIIDGSKIELWERKIFEYNNELEKLQELLREKHPEYYQLRYDVKTVNVEEVKKILKPDEGLIKYYMGDTSLFSFYMDQDTFMVFRHSLNVDFFDRAFYLLSHISHLDFEMPYEERKISLINNARYFYEKLIACFPEDMILNKKRIFIVPDEILAKIPYEIFLFEEEEGSKSYSSLSFLLKKVSIVYAPSTTLLFKSFFHKNGSATYDLGVFGSSDLYYDRKHNIKTDIEMKGVVEEISNLKKNYHAHVYKGPWASKQSFSEIAGKYKILHIATHGDIDDREPMFSRLRFADHDPDSVQNDLYVHELFNMDLKADLAVLSACNTGSGKLQKGEGIMTIARGFQYAGVPAIVMSLWKVSDYATQNIINSFYSHLRSGEPKDQALQKAKIEYLAGADNLISDPFFWAALIQIGNPSPVYRNHPPHYRAYGIFLCLNVLFLAFVIKSTYFRKT